MAPYPDRLVLPTSKCVYELNRLIETRSKRPADVGQAAVVTKIGIEDICDVGSETGKSSVTKYWRDKLVDEFCFLSC